MNEFFARVKAVSDNIPFLRHLGIEMVEADEGYVKLKLKFSPQLLQPFVVHGGAIYSLADAAAAHALMSIVAPSEMVTTVEQRINFLRGTKEQDLFCEARVVNLGKSLAYIDATISHDDGTLIAKSTATLMRLDRERYLRK